MINFLLVFYGQNPGEYYESVHTVSLAARSRHISNVVSSAQKLETPKEKVDMEAKLQTWLESKGKTKSVQRMGPFASRFQGKTPTSISSVKKLNYNRSCKVNSASSAKNRYKITRYLEFPSELTKLMYSLFNFLNIHAGLYSIMKVLLLISR